MKYFKKRNVAYLVTLVALGLSIASCSKKRTTSAASNLTSEAVTNLTTISSGFAPDSLNYSSTQTNNALSYEAQSDPCSLTGKSGLEALFACQPILLRIYVLSAKTFLELTKTIVSGVGEGLGNLSDGTSGSSTSGTQTVTYSKTSSTKYSLLVQENGSSVAYVSVDGNTYTLKMDFSSMSDASASAPGKFEAVVTFTDANNWSVKATALDMACDSTDVRAPRRFRVLMSKVDGLWKGKAIMYNGVWASGIVPSTSDPTCSTSESNAISMALLTDFVGDSSAAKAKVYMTTKTASTAAAIEAAPLSAFCSTYGVSSVCTSYGLDLATSYSNPFCNKSDSFVATWNNTCTSESSAVASAEFGSSSDWTVPSDFASETLTLPTSLE